MMKNNRKIIRNGQLILMLSIFTVLVSACKTHGQIQKSNEGEINKIKSTASKKTIEDNLIGYWEFDKLTTSEGEEIVERNMTVDTLEITEIIKRPNVIFYKSRKYEIIDSQKEEKGSWSYDDKDRLLKFIFDEPKYNVPIDKISEELLKQLKESGGLIEFTEDNWEIHQITDNILSIIEHLPHNEYELKYNLRLYKKRQ